MAEVLSSGVIAVLCTVVITTTVLIILYCICRSKDPLHDHTCIAWLHSPRTLRKRKHKYNELPLYDMQNGRKAPRKDKHRTVERLRMEEKKEKAKPVDAKRNEFYERNPEKCPLSIDEPDYHRREPSGRRETVSREKERRDRSHQNQSRSKEYWEPKAKSVHDIYVNEEYYLRSHPQEYNINKQSRSLNFIANHDLYMHPRPLQPTKENSHYVSPRSIERNQDSNHSYSHSLLPRSLEREGRRGRREERERHSSFHYLRPRSMEPERKGRSHSSHYERPRSVERGVKEDYGHASSHYVNPKPFKDMTDSPYVNLPPPADTRNTRHQDKHHMRSKDNIHANDNYYQNDSLNDNHEKFVNKTREKAPILQASEEIGVSEVQKLSAEIPTRQESERQRDKDGQHHTRYRQEYRDRERMREAREQRQSRPRSRSTEYRRTTTSSHEFNVLGWSDHIKGGKESYFLPRTQSMISARPPRDDESTIGRRHTIHLEFHPRSGDVTPLDCEKESDLKKNREYRPKEPREFSSKRNIGQQDASNHESHARDTKQQQNPNKKSQTEPGKEKHELALPTRYDSPSEEHRGADKNPRSRSEEREESFIIPPRYDSLPDRYRRAEHKTRNSKAGKPTLDKHHRLGPRTSTESTSSRATMESIHREIQSSSIYKTTDDGRLVLRDTINDMSEDKRTQRTWTPGKIPTSGPVKDTRTKRANSPEKNPINGPSDDKGTQKKRTPGKIPTSGPVEDTRTKRTRSPEKNPINGSSDDKGTQRTRTPGKIPTSGPVEDTRTKRTRSPEKNPINGSSDDKGTQRTRTPGKIPTSGPVEDTRTKRTRSPEKNPINGSSDDKGTQRTKKEPDGGRGTQRERTPERKPLKEPNAETQKARIREEKPHKDLGEKTEKREKNPPKQPSEATAESADNTATQKTRVREENSPNETREDTREPTARVHPKRTKSIERVFYVKSVPRSEPTLNIEEPPNVSTDENVDWNLLRLTGEKMDDGSEDERAIQDTPASGLPSKVVSDRNIDWHLFTLPGQDHKPTIVNNYYKEDGSKEASNGLKQTKPTSPKEIDWNLFTINGKRIERKTSTTSTKESIRQSLETQIQYGEELHTPSENSLPRKPIILHFE